MDDDLIKRTKQTIIDVPDFPEPGILFRDITPIFQDPKLRSDITKYLADLYAHTGATAVIGPESRGFLFGLPLAYELGIPFVLARKPGKLPREVFSEKYDLEYGESELQIHRDTLTASDRVIIVDDLLATGGTAAAAARLVEQSGASIVAISFLIELTALNGRGQLGGYRIDSLIKY